MKPDLFWLPGPWRARLAIAPRPRGGDWLQDEVRAWRKAGLGAVVSLLESDEAAQLDLAHEGSAVECAGSVSCRSRFPTAEFQTQPGGHSHYWATSQSRWSKAKTSPFIAAKASGVRA
jgi:hypothetical protein